MLALENTAVIVSLMAPNDDASESTVVILDKLVFETVLFPMLNTYTVTAILRRLLTSTSSQHHSDKLEQKNLFHLFECLVDIGIHVVTIGKFLAHNYSIKRCKISKNM